jgi:acyl carrier protein
VPQITALFRENLSYNGEPKGAHVDDLKRELKQLIITSCALQDLTHEQISDEQPLFQEGLGLDSIDALELAVAIERKYQVTIPDETEARRAFASVNALSDYLQAQLVAARTGT